jgi:hypothetical protein
MPDKPPFLEDGSQYGVSRTAFRRMRKADKQRLMVEWFHQNFQKPDDAGTPWVDGEYLWIWGGPVEARDELYSKFGDIVYENWVEEVVQEVESGATTDWVPNQKPEDWEDIDWSQRYDDPPSLGHYLDEPSPGYGSAQDHEAREKVRQGLTRLQRAIETPRPIGIGHNRPPEELETPEARELLQAVGELTLEFSQRTPSISRVKRWATPLRNALVAAIKWTGKKVDKGIEAAVTTIGGGIGLWILGHWVPPVHNVFAAIIDWLEIVAKPLF